MLYFEANSNFLSQKETKELNGLLSLRRETTSRILILLKLKGGYLLV